MNSKLIILSLAILGIQLINASILKDEDSILETNNVSIKKLSIFDDVQTIAAKKTKKFKDTQSLSFSKSKMLKKGDQKQAQLICLGVTDDQKKLCDKYQASTAVCKNLNYKKEDTPSFECQLKGMKVTNKNVAIATAGVGCSGMDEKNPVEYDLPALCQMAYALKTNDGYDVKDDVKAKTGSKLSTGWIVVIVIIVIALIGGIGFFAYSKTRA